MTLNILWLTKDPQETCIKEAAVTMCKTQRASLIEPVSDLDDKKLPYFYTSRCCVKRIFRYSWIYWFQFKDPVLHNNTVPLRHSLSLLFLPLELLLAQIQLSLHLVQLSHRWHLQTRRTPTELSVTEVSRKWTCAQFKPSVLSGLCPYLCSAMFFIFLLFLIHTMSRLAQAPRFSPVVLLLQQLHTVPLEQHLRAACTISQWHLSWALWHMRTMQSVTNVEVGNWWRWLDFTTKQAVLTERTDYF